MIARSRCAQLAVLACFSMFLAACGSTPKQTSDGPLGGPPDPVPKVEPKSRYGNMASYVVHGRRYHTKRTSRNFIERGVASWYGRKFHGRKTSSGERYDMNQMTAAHKTLPLPTYALVTNLDNGHRAVVKINDRGPFVDDRVIDLSYAAARRLDMVASGTARVEVRSIDPRDHGGDAKASLLLASADVVQKTPKRAATAAPVSPSPGPKSAPNGGIATAISSPEFRTSPASVAKGPVPEPAIARSPKGPPSSVSLAATQGAAIQGAAVDASLRSAVYLQVGAFGDRVNAEQLQSQLIAAVEQPVLVQEPGVGGASARLYKVRVGPLDSDLEADALGRRLAALGISSPMLVRR